MTTAIGFDMEYGGRVIIFWIDHEGRENSIHVDLDIARGDRIRFAALLKAVAVAYETIG